MSNGNQFIRKCSLWIVNGQGQPIDLSQFRIKFKICASDLSSPNSADIRVYNLDPETINSIQSEYQGVILSAGYENGGSFGAIFSGTVKQYRIGKESNVDTYFDILAADGDMNVNYSPMNASIGAGSTPFDHITAAAGAMGIPLTAHSKQGILSAFGGTLPNPRGKVMFGMARGVMRSTASRLSMSWSVQNGQLQMLPYDGYLPDEPVQISEFTGLIGIPELTNEGLVAKCLLNPQIKVGQLASIDSRVINQLLFVDPNLPVPYNQYTGLQYVATANANGLYRVYVIEYEGDTRGGPWYSHLTCLATDQSSGLVKTAPTGAPVPPPGSQHGSP